MQVKKRLQINSVGSVMTAFVIVLVLFLALHRVNHALEESDIAGEIITTAFERSTLRSDYLRTYSDRAKKQWFAKHEQMGGLLKSASGKFRDAEDKRIIEEMIRDQDSTGKIFSSIVANREKRRSDADSALSQETESRLVSQLEMRLYDKVLNARKFARGRRQAPVLRPQAGRRGYRLCYRNRDRSSNTQFMDNGPDHCRSYREASPWRSVIGGGNLDHRIDIKGDDEFAELSRAFDAMTAKLRGSYMDLEKEIAERRQMEEVLRESEKRYHSLFEHMLDGFAYCKMLFDDHGRPEDFVYLDVNTSFARLTGLENVVGKKVTEIIPEIKESNPELFEIYGRVALTGQPEKFEIEIKPLEIWFSISVYSTGREYFVAVFDNITERKQAEEALQKLTKSWKYGSRSGRRNWKKAAQNWRCRMRNCRRPITSWRWKPPNASGRWKNSGKRTGC